MANRRFESDLFGTRERLGMRVIEMTTAPRGVLRSLRRGRVVAMLGDQNAHRSGVFVPFFGVDAATARGPALFALRSSAPVFFGVALREPGWAPRYRVEAHPVPVEPTGDLEADTRALLTRYMASVEASVQRAPEQYFWHHKRWKTRPPEEQAPPG
jgi:KDO2-lipid IV(A) lauroyltransferase